MATLLFIDDDESFLRTNRIYFEGRGERVLAAQSYHQGLELLKGQPVDCVILDILMPGTDGWEACRMLKERSQVPIIFLTSLSERECPYRGFDLGADDYITKPYDFRELELRIRARIAQNRPSSAQSRLLFFPPLEIDQAGRRATVQGKTIPLTAYEFDILLLLAQAPGRVFQLEEIYQAVWNQPDLGNTTAVRSHLSRMRHKLEEACPTRQFIDLVWGRGFFFREKESEET